MALQLILGSSGSGKTRELYQRVIRASVEDRERSFYVLVPEQFTMQAQRELVALHPDHVILNIEVLSFQRLAIRIMDDLGTRTGEVLGNTGKNLAIRRAVEMEEGDLTVLKGSVSRPGMITELRSLFSELKQYRVGPNALEEMGEKEGLTPPFQKKTEDLTRIYEAFLHFIQDKYITTEDILELFLTSAHRSKKLSGAFLALDGFTGLTPIQKEVMRELMSLAGEVDCTVTIRPDADPMREEGEDDLFLMSKRMIRDLMEIEEDLGHEVPPPIFLSGEKGRFLSGGRLSRLEEGLFSDRKWEKVSLKGGRNVRGQEETGGFPDEKVPSGEGPSDQVMLYSLPDPRGEVVFAAGRIASLVRTKKLHYKDFAIVTGDLEGCRVYAQEVFQKYHIPLFIDYKEGVTSHPLVLFIHALFQNRREDWSYRSLIRVLRSGIPVLSTEETDTLDLYLKASGIRGRRAFALPFRRRAGTYSREDLARLNEIRKKLLSRIGAFDGALSDAGKDVEKIAEALYDCLSLVRAEDAVKKKAEDLAAAGDEKAARSWGEIWGDLIDLLRQMTSLLKGDPVTPEEFDELLESGFESVRVGSIPASTDCVVLGDLMRTRLSDVSYLFVLGANDGIIPANDTRGGILSETEREILSEDGVRLAPTARERAYRQKFYLYLSLTKPSRGLFITFSRTKADGGEARPSYLVNEIRSIFPGLPVMNETDVSLLEKAVTQRTLKTEVIRLLRAREDGHPDPRKEEEAALLSYMKEKDPKGLEAILKDIRYVHQPEKLDKGLLREMSGGRLRGSVSLLEQYASCAYSYFLKYGLGLTEEKEYGLKAPDIGTIYHKALEEYSRLVTSGGKEWGDLDEEEEGAYLKKALEITYLDLDRPEFSEDPAQAFRLGEMEDTLRTSVHLITDQVKRGSFRPKGFEVDFSTYGDLETLKEELSDGTILSFRGRIDRVDAMTDPEGGDVYLRIIDYKSGRMDPDPGRAMAGLQIQLLLYMRAALEGEGKLTGKKVRPGAVLYYHIEDPVIEEKKGPLSPEEGEKALLSAVARGGIVNSDPKVLSAMDSSDEKHSPLIPSSGGQVTEEEFDSILDEIKAIVKREAEEIRDGKIEVRPIRQGSWTSCDYCPYHSVCGFDEGLKGYSYREIRKCSWKEAASHGREDLDKGAE